MKNPLGRYKEERICNGWLLRLQCVGDKIMFMVRRRSTYNPWQRDEEWRYKSGLFDSPKEALKIAKQFLK